jgi:hypothetical protein
MEPAIMSDTEVTLASNDSDTSSRQDPQIQKTNEKRLRQQKYSTQKHTNKATCHTATTSKHNRIMKE